MYFRAAACTGALYHIDVYVICGDIPGLGAGVYHFGPNDFGLVRLREGDYRGVLAAASGKEKAIAEAPVTLLLADTHWRNAWKYGARAYRHAFWDAGTLLANTLAAASGAGMPAKIVTSFVDEEVHRLLGLEGEKESVVALVPLGRDSGATPAVPHSVDSLAMPTEPLSPKMVEYPAIYDLNRSSSLDSPEDAADVRGRTPAPRSYESAGEIVQLPRNGEVKVRGLEETIGDGLYEDVCFRPDSLESFRRIHFQTRGIDADFCRHTGRRKEMFPDSQFVGVLARGRTDMTRGTRLNCEEVISGGSGTPGLDRRFRRRQRNVNAYKP